ncbi:DNA mismatch repair protein MutS [Gracilinema caldarium]|uniref:DNA mismatch repair protein MutS n=1 Tax=Gracilinema caldarium TaxID=215591 RepID=UPI0026ED0F3C|nr:DNA mismatch repair protein MutS [Gracilinema caldarium]
MADSSPMIEQYRRIKNDYRETVLFFRLGDFYEMFAEDALEVSSLLNLTLTSRNGLPMCGVPYHASRSYISRLLKLGKKVAICEQLTEPGRGRGIIERQVMEVITPGTTVDDDFLEKGSANYLAALGSYRQHFSFAYIDISTGDFWTTAFLREDGEERLRREIERLQPKEIIIQESLLESYSYLQDSILDRSGLVVNRWADWLFDMDQSRSRLTAQFGTANLKPFGLDDTSPEILAAGVLLEYVDDTARSVLPHLKTLHRYGDEEFVGIDEASQKNLELVRNLRDGDVHFSLLEVMDHTKTAMGRRLLYWRILHPVRDIDVINKRLSMVEILYHRQESLAKIRDILGRASDLERLSSRLAMDKAHGKDMVALRNSLGVFDSLSRIIEDCQIPSEYEDTPDSQSREKLMELKAELDRALLDEPSILLTEGNLIRPGYSKELDELQALKNNGRQLLETYLEEERKLTGISSLKIKYNRLIGYYFEVTKSNLSLVPPHFIRRQGVVGGERFTTDRLAALESDINGASDKIIELEKKLFLELRQRAKLLIGELGAAGRRMAEIDVCQALARAATVNGWTRPVVSPEQKLKIIEGRHPVVEAHLPRGEFIPNDIILDTQDIAFALITGPNMAGKSTYLRQTALITLMAQMGSFVPAREAEIGIVDRIFCRVGASDNVARGESTFLVEMNETANILHAATGQSLVIMDEVGRGTGTNDGLSIAWAVCEELLDHIRCRTLFATHYHELSRIEHPRLANRSMEVLEQDGKIVFLRKLREGATEESYGLFVAQLAGLPSSVLARAAQILENLRRTENELKDRITGLQEKNAETAAPEALDTFPQGVMQRIVKELANLDLDRLTPLEALTRLYAWKEMTQEIRHKPKKPTASGPSLFED